MVNGVRAWVHACVRACVHACPCICEREFVCIGHTGIYVYVHVCMCVRDDLSIVCTTHSADSTVSSFADSSVQHRGLRPNLIAMKNRNSQKPKFKPGSSYLARVLKRVNQFLMHNANSESSTRRECSAKHEAIASTK